MNFVGSCTSWLCSNTASEKQLPSPTDVAGSQTAATNTTPAANNTTTTNSSGPGPSPGSSNSCDDVIPPQKNCYRLVMLGSARVGKTCLVARFLGGKFQESYTPTIEDFHRKLYRIRGEIHQLDLLDTSGNHPFPAMRRLSFLTGDLFVIVFSMDSRETFEEAIRLREQILETKLNAGAAANSSVGLTKKKIMPRVPMVLAGNKCDREMKTVTVEEVQAYCESQNSSCVFVETSAKKNLKVDEVFYQLFLIANLPLEMAPNHHKRVHASFGAPCPLPPPQPSHHAKSGPRMNVSQMNGSSRRMTNINRLPPQQHQQQQQQQQQQFDKHTSSQHEELIRYIHDSWSKVSQELDRSNGNTTYYNEQEPHHLKNFKPFDLQAYCGRRIVQMQSQSQHS